VDDVARAPQQQHRRVLSRLRPGREAAIELPQQLVADEVDERADAQLLARMVDEDEEGERACRRQRERGQHRHHRHRLAGRAGVDRAQREDREREGRAENGDRELVAAVVEQGADDPRRELPHRQLHRDERHRQHHRRQRHDGRRDRRQDRLRVGRVAHDALRQQLVLVPAVDRNCHEREQDPAEEAE
jgi:hypothetical protein